MKRIRLDNPPNFTNITYKQQFLEKQNEYNTLLSRISTAYNTVEYLNVVEGTRDAHLMFIKSNEVEIKTEQFKKYGLSIVLLNKEADNTNGNYGNHSKDYDGGPSYVWRSIVTKDVTKWKDIWNTRDNNVLLGEYLVGKGLGYPDCCSKFFTQVWMSDGGIDTTWQQALSTVHPIKQVEQKDSWWQFSNTQETTLELPDTTPIWASNLLRWAGLKLVAHLPCSFDCKESKRIALENIGIATKHGFGNEYNKLCQMLDWEITWTAQYGVATIETPVFVITTATDVTTEKYTVIKHGHNNCVL